MGRRSKPWFRTARKLWYVKLAGKQICLGADYQKAIEDWKFLVANREKTLAKYSHGGVYFIKNMSNGAIKIGYAYRPSQRLAELQAATPDTLKVLVVIPGSISTEKWFHRRFAEDNIRGEWFEPSRDILDFLYGSQPNLKF